MSNSGAPMIGALKLGAPDSCASRFGALVASSDLALSAAIFGAEISGASSCSAPGRGAPGLGAPSSATAFLGAVNSGAPALDPGTSGGAGKPIPCAMRRCSSRSTPIRTTPSAGNSPGRRSLLCAARRSSNVTSSTGRFFRGLFGGCGGGGGDVDIHDLRKTAGGRRVIFQGFGPRIMVREE